MQASLASHSATLCAQVTNCSKLRSEQGVCTVLSCHAAVPVQFWVDGWEDVVHAVAAIGKLPAEARGLRPNS